MSIDKIDSVIVDGVKWYKARQLAKMLGYPAHNKAIRVNVDTNDKKKFEELVVRNPSYDYNERISLYINEDGLSKLILQSNKPKSIHIAKDLDITVKMKYLRKEIEVVSFIQSFLTGLKIPFEFQKSVDKYRIDLFLPIQKLAIEIDENGHKDRNQMYEQTREETLTTLLSCKFMRINPDDRDFNIALCLSNITRVIIETIQREQLS